MTDRLGERQLVATRDANFASAICQPFWLQRLVGQVIHEAPAVEALGLRTSASISAASFVSLSLIPDTSCVDSIIMGFLLWVLVVVLREVFRATTTERDAVVGALRGFVLIVAVFTRLHGLLEALFPGSYHADGPPLSERSDIRLTAVFQYFSTITVTTVGFGDIVPVTPPASRRGWRRS